MTANEFAEWMAFARLEPFGAHVDYHRAGVVAATVANTQRDPKRRPQPFQARDFIPRFGPPPPAAEEAARVSAKVMQVMDQFVHKPDRRG